MAADPSTSVIVLISSLPRPEVANVLEVAGWGRKTGGGEFLGADPEESGVQYSRSGLLNAAAAAVALADGRRPEEGRPERPPFAMPLKLVPGQQYLRGLYSGGTFCYEASLLLKKTLGQVYSNTPVDPGDRLDDVWTSRGHTVIDLGDDLFTRGRPHP
jgi:hypothetical protein